MKLLSNAKINLGLNVIARRADGYHNIESLFLPIPWSDEIYIEKAQEFALFTDGIPIPDGGLPNTCVKAYELMKTAYDIPPVHIHLNKHIPTGAGLGGGSSNASFVLKALNQLFQLKLSTGNLESIALQIGSDCPFFIYNKPCFVSGTGDKLDFNLDFQLEAYGVMVNPGVHINTAKAYASLRPKAPRMPLREAIQLPKFQWQGKIINDFEAVVLKQYPHLERVRQKLIDLGAFYVSMSGSGSTFYGLFEEAPSNLQFREDMHWSAFDLSA